MTKFTVTDTALKAGEPWGHAPIRVELVDTNGDPVTPAYVTSTGVLVEPFTTVAGADGVFTVTLDATDEIAPTGCLYNVRIGDVDNLINGDQGSGTVRGLRATTATVLGNTATLDGLSNVNTAGKADGDALVWDTATSKWIAEAGGAGGVTSVSGTAPITSSGGATPAIGITAATSGAAGSMSAADKSKLDGIEAGATADQSAAEILAAVKTVDGTGSGLDADLLDGQHASAFEAAGAVTAHTGAVDPHGDRAYAAGLVDDLSGVTNAASARTALGLGTAAVVDTGTGATNAILGNDSRLSDTRTPTAGSVVDNSVASNAAIALSKLASISTARLLGRTTAGSGAIEELTQAGVFAFLGTGTPSGTTFLRGDGSWSTPAGGSVATDTIFDAKGDLAVGTGADTASKLTVGANGLIPAARSGETTGIGWVDAVPCGRVKGGGTTFYSLPGVVIVAANSSLLHTDARIYYHPIQVRQGQSLTFDQVACEVSGAGAGSAIRLGLYTADEDWQPSALVADFGTVDSTGTGVKTVSSTNTLTPGRYLLCSIQQGGSNATLRAYRGGVIGGAGIATTLGATGLGYTLQKSTSGISGALPGTPVAWDTMLTQVTPHEYPILLRITDPSAG